MLMNFSNLALVTTLVDMNINFLSAKLLLVCVQFFSVNNEHVVNIWNSLPDDVSFDSFYRFKFSIKRINLSSYLRYYGRLSSFLFYFFL